MHQEGPIPEVYYLGIEIFWYWAHKFQVWRVVRFFVHLSVSSFTDHLYVKKYTIFKFFFNLSCWIWLVQLVPSVSLRIQILYMHLALVHRRQFSNSHWSCGYKTLKDFAKHSITRCSQILHVQIQKQVTNCRLWTKLLDCKCKHARYKNAAYNFQSRFERCTMLWHLMSSLEKRQWFRAMLTLQFLLYSPFILRSVGWCTERKVEQFHSSCPLQGIPHML